MLKVIGRFLVGFIPTCAGVMGGLWLGVHRSGLWSVAGWMIAFAFSVAAILETIVLIDGFLKMNRWSRAAEQRLHELEERDAELFAQGKSFDEVMSQYKTPKF